MADIGSEAFRFTKDMGLCHRDFFRLLPAAIKPRSYRRQGDQVLIQENSDKCVEIKLHPEQQRKIAAIAMIHTLVEFQFQGYSSAEKDAFMHQFNLCFQRGGG